MLTDVVAVGIGGSFLGPLFVHTALQTGEPNIINIFNKIVATIEIGAFSLVNFVVCKVTFLTILLQPLWCGIRLQ